MDTMDMIALILLVIQFVKSLQMRSSAYKFSVEGRRTNKMKYPPDPKFYRVIQ